MNTTLNTDVLIVGAGPTGLMAACQLSRFDVDFIIIDKKPGPTKESRAIAVTPRSLEIYQQMGLSDFILEHGTKINSFHLYMGGKPKATINLGEIGKGKSDFTFLMAFEQSKNEELLYKHLLQQGRDVMWNTEFVKFLENNESIKSEVTQHNKTIEIHSRYLIGCDGASSPIRHALNFSFEGGTYENRFFVADTILKWSVPYDQLMIAPGDRNFVGFFPLKGEGAYRVLGTLPDDRRYDENITFEDIKQVVIDTTAIPITFEKVNWFSTYKLHHRCVNKFREGNVFLAGDSAHIHSPAGGQGMNTGLQDAYNIAWKLAYTIQGYADAILLETYSEERLPFAQWLMKVTDRMFMLMTSDKWITQVLRKYFVVFLMGRIFKEEWLRPFIFNRFSQLWYSYKDYSFTRNFSKQPLKFSAGDRLPYKELNNGPRFYEKFRGNTFFLLHIGPKDFQENPPFPKQKFSFPLEYISEPLDDHWRKLGIEGNLYVLVRPDNYIAWVADDLKGLRIVEWQKKFFKKSSA